MITRLGKEPVRSAQDLVSRVAVLQPGAVVEVEGRHGNKPYKVSLKVLERTNRPVQEPQPQ